MALKKFIYISTVCFCMISCFTPVYASVSTVAAPAADASIQRNDVYEYIYQTIDGIKYRRLWNITKGCWAEPGWTRCP